MPCKVLFVGSRGSAFWPLSTRRPGHLLATNNKAFSLQIPTEFPEFIDVTQGDCFYFTTKLLKFSTLYQIQISTFRDRGKLPPQLFFLAPLSHQPPALYKFSHNGTDRSNNPLDLPPISRSLTNTHNPQSIHRALPTIAAILSASQSPLQRPATSTSPSHRCGDSEHWRRGEERQWAAESGS